MSFHRDRLLSLLYTMRDAGGDDNGITLAQVSGCTGLDADHTFELVQWMRLTKPKLIDTNIHNAIVLTPRGIRWVEESPKRSE